MPPGLLYWLVAASFLVPLYRLPLLSSSFLVALLLLADFQVSLEVTLQLSAMGTIGLIVDILNVGHKDLFFQESFPTGGALEVSLPLHLLLAMYFPCMYN